jgi:hypothetical protein
VAIVTYVQLGVALFTLAALISVWVELRRGRRVNEEIREAIRAASDAQRAHREEVLGRAAVALRGVLDAADGRTFVIEPPRANDATPSDEPEPPGEGGEVIPFPPKR